MQGDDGAMRRDRPSRGNRDVRAGTGSFGAIDILVNNAGNAGPDPRAVSRKPFWEQEAADWQPFLGTNLYGVLNCVRAGRPR